MGDGSKHGSAVLQNWHAPRCILPGVYRAWMPSRRLPRTTTNRWGLPRTTNPFADPHAATLLRNKLRKGNSLNRSVETHHLILFEMVRRDLARTILAKCMNLSNAA